MTTKRVTLDDAQTVDAGRVRMQWSEEAVEQVYEAIGDRIRAARSRCRVTQTELAQRVGLTRSSIANIEAGRQRAMIHTVLQIAGVMDVPLGDLVPACVSASSHTSALLPSDTLDGQPPTTRDFVTSALRRAAGE